MSQKNEHLPEQSMINYQFKILYALGMLFVVVGHSSYGGLTFFTDWFPFEGFHVALFVFCSGYLYKSDYESKCGLYVKKKLRSLILPLYVWNFLYGILVAVLSRFGFTIGEAVNLDTLFLSPIRDGHQFAYNMAGWFVVSLFLIEMFNIFFRKMIPANGTVKELIIFSAYIAIGVIGNSVAIRGYTHGWWVVLVRFMHLLPFFGLGMLYRSVLEKYDKVNNYVYFGVVAALQLVVIFYLGGPPHYVPSWCRNFVDGPVMPILYGFIAIAFWLRVAGVLEPAIGRSRLVLSIADNSYAIMIHQFAGFMLLKTVYAFLHVYAGVFSDFDLDSYRSDIWYRYYPGGYIQTGILYIIAGIAVPIILQKITSELLKICRSVTGKKIF